MNSVYLKYKNLKVSELRNICKQYKIKKYYKLRKKELIDLIVKIIEKNGIKKCIKCNKNIKKYNYISYKNNKYEHLECYNKENNIKQIKKKCSICLENISQKEEFKTECNHYFHKDCIQLWDNREIARNKCPNCRQNMKKIMVFSEIHNEVVRTSENILNIGLNNKDMLEYSDLFFQTMYIYILFKKTNKPNEELHYIIDEFYSDIDLYLNTILTNGTI